MRKIGVVLAGGASRRMGVDKLSLPIYPEDRTTILEHVVNCVCQVADDVYIAHAPEPSLALNVFAAFSSTGSQTVEITSAGNSSFVNTSSGKSATGSLVHFLPDETWYNGPLGVLARLYTSLPKAEFVFVVAGDLPGLHFNVLKACGDALLRLEAFDAALVRRNGTLQPLLGCYRRHALSAFFDAWQADETRLMPTMEKLKIEPVVAEEAKWPSWWTKPVHTPEDYAIWKREWREYHAT